MISYIGGKSRIGKWIREYIPEDIETYVETFGGMFWVYFCMDLEKYPNLKTVVYNDFNQLNSNLFDCVREYDKLHQTLSEQDCQQYKIADTPEQLETHRNMFNEYQKEIFADGFVIKDKFDVAKKYTFVLTQIFSGSQPEKSKYMDYKGKYRPKFLTFMDKLKNEKYRKHFDKITFVENMDYSDVIKKHDSPSTYFYVDPPYWKTENYYSKHDFDRDDHEKLCLQLKDIQGKFSLSYYDFDLLQEWLPKDKYIWEMKEFTKQAGNRKGGTLNKGEELLIMNYSKNTHNFF